MESFKFDNENELNLSTRSNSPLKPLKQYDTNKILKSFNPNKATPTKLKVNEKLAHITDESNLEQELNKITQEHLDALGSGKENDYHSIYRHHTDDNEYKNNSLNNNNFDPNLDTYYRKELLQNAMRLSSLTISNPINMNLKFMMKFENLMKSNNDETCLTIGSYIELVELVYEILGESMRKQSQLEVYNIKKKILVEKLIDTIKQVDDKGTKNETNFKLSNLFDESTIVQSMNMFNANDSVSSLEFSCTDC